MPETQPGSPLAVGPTTPQQIIADLGDYDASNGCRVLLMGDHLVFLASIDGNDLTLGIDIWQVLDAISAYTRKSES